ncbi:hypothetical protein P7C70_g7694, partial [Phenoliferia sp. Uapishka_3]
MGTHQPNYTPSQLYHLKQSNKFVQVYLITALLSAFLIAVLVNILAKSLSYIRRKYAARFVGKLRPSAACSRSGKGCTMWLPGTMLAGIRKLGCRRSKVAEAIGMSSLAEVGLIGSYYVLNIVLVVTSSAGSIDYMAHHAARLVFANLPLVIGLASKNNAISYLSGFSYESLNVFHRWIARLVLILSIFHVIGRTYVNVPSANPRGVGQAYVRWGIVAFIIFFLMILGAARPIRNRWYQAFIISHVGAFLLGTVALCIHRPEIAPWLYAGFIIYFLDRIIRTGRIVLHHTFRPVEAESVDGETGTVEALSDCMLRVTVQTTLTWIPGQHIYLHVPFLSAGGHPFSVCSIDKPMTQVSDERPKHSRVVLLVRVREGLTRCLYDLAMGDVEKNERSHAVGRFPKATLSPCWAEGPYGNLSHLDYYQTVLLVAGGSGVSFTLSVMQDIVRRARSMSLGHSEVAVATERLTFVWVIKKQEDMAWISEALNEVATLAPVHFLRILIYITTGPIPSPSGSSTPSLSLDRSYSPTSTLQNSMPDFVPSRRASLSMTSRLVESTLPFAHAVMAHIPSPGEEKASPKLDDQNTMTSQTQVHKPTEIQYFSGRPKMAEILEAEIEATDFSDYCALGACGPAGLTASVANAVSDAIQPSKVLRGEHRRNIRLHTEEFGW